RVAAEKAVTLGEYRLGAGRRRAERGAEPRGPAADHEHVGLARDLRPPRRQLDAAYLRRMLKGGHRTPTLVSWRPLRRDPTTGAAPQFRWFRPLGLAARGVCAEFFPSIHRGCPSCGRCARSSGPR